MIFEKIAIALLVMLDFWHDVRQFILKPVRRYPKVEVALVMLIVPFIINVSCEFIAEYVNLPVTFYSFKSIYFVSTLFTSFFRQ